MGKSQQRLKISFVRLTTVLILSLVVLTAYQNCGAPPRNVIPVDLASSVGVFGSSATDNKDSQVSQQCGADYAPGHVPMRLLSNDEYDNTVQDLLYVVATPGAGFPQMSIGKSGFRNDASNPRLSDELIQKLYDSAESLATQVINTKGTSGGAYSKLVTCGASLTQDTCIRKVVLELGARAYRRPLLNAETTSLINVFKQGASFDTGLHDLIVALLIDPKFLFIYISNPAGQDPNATYFVSNYELASRLSYFLWQTMPDQELTQLANSGQLSETETLKAQIKRMLKHSKAQNLVKVLKREWAGLGKLESSAVTGLDETLRAAMLKESELFIQDLVQNDQNMLNVVNGKYAFVNKALATHYGLPFTNSDANAFVKVALNDNRHLGLVTSASVLTATAGSPDVTHPVRRGYWVAERIYCQPPPPPPANFSISHTPDANSTIRQRLEEHTKNPSCIGCHKLMDTFGLGLENYDALGRWRTTYGTLPIDASGTLPSNQTFTTPIEMYSSLATDPNVKSCLARQVMSYALSRELAHVGSDSCVARAIGQVSVNGVKTFSDLIERIVFSRQFRMQTGESL